MCLLAFDYHPEHPLRLRLVANRDEFHARPSAALHAWNDRPAIVGGRDLLAGGTWLAIHRRGRFAAVTNVRDPGMRMPTGTPSRGHLVRDALECSDLEGWLRDMAAREASRYAGFNLLVGDENGLWHLHRSRVSIHLEAVSPGIHAISNADLDTSWPKVELARSGLARSLGEAEHWRETMLDVMGDSRPVEDPQRLPDTGIGLELEKRLSPPFIVGDDYGTRVKSWLEWQAGKHIEIGEQRFGPGGEPLGETRMQIECER